MNIYNRILQILRAHLPAKFFLILLVAIAISITSCDKSSVVGLNVQPSSDLLHVGYQDTTTLITKTIREDSLRTDQGLIYNGIVLLGKYIDPVFGEASASVYTQVRTVSDLSTTSFGTSPVCDSLVLFLVYDSTYYYGEHVKKSQKINVYRITDDLSSSIEYYSNKTVAVDPLDLTYGNAGHLFIPHPFDDATFTNGSGTLREQPEVQILLDRNFGQTILNDQALGYLADNTTFITQCLKGLYITTENTTGLAKGEGSILRFRMASSVMRMYYHNTAYPHLTYDFDLGNAVRFNHFNHYNYPISSLSGSFPVLADLYNQLSDKSSNPSNPFVSTKKQTQNDLVYVESMSGTKVKIELPYLSHWRDNGAIAINKAELVVTVDPNYTYTATDSFPTPTSLVVFGINDDDSTSYLLPDELEGSGYYGGGLNAVAETYGFNIARYVQQVLDGKIQNHGLYLLVSSGAVYANRAVIGGGAKTSPYQMKLNITYTKLHH
jgi:hypothetical protein